ncbi:Selenoprotein P, N-terminal domain-containing protein [Strongyloides ratti]|uniref:Selenoprotein P, N-terminal domain-containing protein n=1 Tax=Strongyloides ratti TaxID=34506 RepID=A0A090LRH7_STRRB|nr:Selenoprotein P, N-terminal domain-containing protein [Strongyloides ratti]CEF70757.1 Selenoprotein P, N-terminal domain-containing protein [Strongyloides ratti]
MKLCTNVSNKVWFKNKDFIQPYIGNILYLTKITYSNRNVENEIFQFNRLGAMLRDIKFLILIDKEFDQNYLTTLKNRYTYVSIIQDDGGQFDPYYYLNASDDEKLLFDRCGRLAMVRKKQPINDQSFMEEYNILNRAVNYAYCGWCKYDTSKNQKNNINNYNTYQQQGRNFIKDGSYTNVEPKNTNIDSQYAKTNTKYDNFPNDVNDKKITLNPTIKAINNNKKFNPTINKNPNNIENLFYGTVKPYEVNYISNKKMEKNVNDKKSFNDFNINTGNKNYPDVVSLYPDTSDQVSIEDYEYLDIADIPLTTESTRNQIPQPTPTNIQLWPTYNSGQFDYQINMPCAGFTDEICFHQKANMPLNKVHRCCHERILLTDLCVPGKCSNVTIQLCCIQKFLQSKHKCCNDEEQSRSHSPTDSFNRCCFENFISGDDDCCPSGHAENQWRDIYDLCFPNVEFDLSNIKVPTFISGSVVISEFDFSKTDEWKFSCPYGSQSQQWAYLESENGNENNLIT